MALLEARSYALSDRTLIVRTATEEDAAELHDLYRTLYGETQYLSRHSDEVPDKHELLEKRLRSQLGAESDLFLVAMVDGRLVGMASLTGSPLRRFAHSAELAIAITKDNWGFGIGRRLMAALCDWADARGLVRIALEVAANNTRAIDLYRTFGFEIEGRLRARRKEGDGYVDGLVMGRVNTAALPEPQG